MRTRLLCFLHFATPFGVDCFAPTLRPHAAQKRMQTLTQLLLGQRHRVTGRHHAGWQQYTQRCQFTPHVVEELFHRQTLDRTGGTCAAAT
jgi:hypothetical protein